MNPSDYNILIAWSLAARLETPSEMLDTTQLVATFEPAKPASRISMETYSIYLTENGTGWSPTRRVRIYATAACAGSTSEMTAGKIW